MTTDEVAVPPTASAADEPPRTGDIVIDAALQDLAAVPSDDLGATITAGEALAATLQARLSDLGE